MKEGLYWINTPKGWVVANYVDYNGVYKWFYANTAKVVTEVLQVHTEEIKPPYEEAH